MAFSLPCRGEAGRWRHSITQDTVEGLPQMSSRAPPPTILQGSQHIPSLVRKSARRSTGEAMAWMVALHCANHGRNPPRRRKPKKFLLPRRPTLGAAWLDRGLAQPAPPNVRFLDGPSRPHRVRVPMLTGRSRSRLEGCQYRGRCHWQVWRSSQSRAIAPTATVALCTLAQLACAW